MVKRWAIFDLDNTIADISNRLQIASENGKVDYFRLHDPELIKTDEPMYETIDLINSLAKFNVGIFILTGRLSSTRKETEKWLNHHNVFYDKLQMKSYNDRFVKSDKWKLQKMVEFMRQKYLSFQHIVLACDDDKKNRYMFESYEIVCLDPFNVTN